MARGMVDCKKRRTGEEEVAQDEGAGFKKGGDQFGEQGRGSGVDHCGAESGVHECAYDLFSQGFEC